MAFRGAALTSKEIDKELDTAQISRINDLRFKLIPERKPAANSEEVQLLRTSEVMMFDTTKVLPAEQLKSHAIILLPYSQPRPVSRNFCRNCSFATILTPLTLAVDIVAFPCQAAYAVSHR